MTTANHRVNAHPLADLPVRHPIANGVDNAVEFMANNAGYLAKDYARGRYGYRNRKSPPA